MSKGYIPRKKLEARRLRKLRKESQNFSCATCAKNQTFSCSKIYKVTKAGIGVYHRENCPDWKGND